MEKNKLIYITATDTGVGKTVATFVLANLMRAQGKRVGVLKPVQCGGNDAQFLKKALHLDDAIEIINPCYAKESLSPHLAFRRAGTSVNIPKIKKALKQLQQKYDVVLIEGAGGLMVPLKANYYNADLIKDLKAEVIVVARLGLGTINHTLLTINQVKAHGLGLKGVIFSDQNDKKKSIAELTNPDEIRKLSGVRILGTIPFLRLKTPNAALRLCQNIQIN